MAKATRALATRTDDRPFLVQTVDRALATGAWTTIDVDLLASDCVQLAFRYLAQRRWDVRDLDAVRTAMGIVTMFVDDGLRTFSSGDFDHAVAILSSPRPVSDCFRKSRNNDIEALRRALDAVGPLARIHVGPARSGAVLAALPADLRDALRAAATFSDEKLLEEFRADGGIAGTCAALRQRIADAERYRRVLDLLPFGEVADRWSHLLHSDAYAAAPDGARDAYTAAWIGALVRATMRGDLGVVVRAAELRAFIDAHTVPVSNAAPAFALAPGVRTAAVATIVRLLGASLREGDSGVVDDGIADAETVMLTSLNFARDERWSPARWLNVFAEDAFLEVTEEERAIALTEVAAMIGDPEITIDRIASATSAADRRTLLAALDVSTLVPDTLARAFDAAGAQAPALLARVPWDALDADAIWTLLSTDLSEDVERGIVRSLLGRTTGVRDLPEDVVHACILGTHDDVALLTTFLTAWAPSPTTLITAFRRSGSAEVQWDWVRFAACNPALLTALISDAQSFPNEAETIARAITGCRETGGQPLVPDAALAAFFLHGVRRGRRAHGAPRFPDRAQFRNPELRWVWSLLTERQRAAVRSAFAAPSASHQERNRRPRVRSK